MYSSLVKVYMDVDCSDLDSGAEEKEEEKTQEIKNEKSGTL